MNDYGLMMRFVDQSESYCYGFEAGCIWATMCAGINVNSLVHEQNLMQLQLMAAKLDYKAEFEKTETPEWFQMKAEMSKNHG